MSIEIAGKRTLRVRCDHCSASSGEHSNHVRKKSMVDGRFIAVFRENEREPKEHICITCVGEGKRPATIGGVMPSTMPMSSSFENLAGMVTGRPMPRVYDGLQEAEPAPDSSEVEGTLIDENGQPIEDDPIEDEPMEEHMLGEGSKICITGSLPHGLNRSKMKSFIQDIGLSMTQNATRADLLIAEESGGKKFRDAMNNDVPIMSCAAALEEISKYAKENLSEHGWNEALIQNDIPEAAFVEYDVESESKPLQLQGPGMMKRMLALRSDVAKVLEEDGEDVFGV